METLDYGANASYNDLGGALSLDYDYRRLRKKGRGYCEAVLKHEMRMQRLLQRKNDTDELMERKWWYTDAVAVDFLSCKDVPESWYNAYKGSGAYFTMKNLIMFHHCKFHVNGQILDRESSIEYLKKINFDRSTTGDLMLSTMKKLMDDNNYTYDRYLSVILYKKR